MKIYITLFLFIISFPFVRGENDRIPVSIKGYSIETRYLNSDISALVLDFEDARLDDAFGMLPVYIKRIKLPSNNLAVTGTMIKEYTSLFMQSGIQDVADISYVGPEFKLVTSIVYEWGVAYAEILILPFRNVKDNEVEVLDSCVVELEYKVIMSATEPVKSSFVENSVLSAGYWYRIATDKNGIYKISYEDLEEMGISPSTLDPSKIRLFGNGNGIIPEKNTDDRFDDLIENSIYVQGEEDGVFDEEDFILFYGQSSMKWNFVPFQGYGLFLHKINHYTDQTFYFLNIGSQAGKRVSPIEYPGLTPSVYVSEFSDYDVHEADKVNILKTGREWYGEAFGEQTVYEFTFNFPNISEDYMASLKTNIAGRSTIESNFDFYYGNQHLLKAPISKIIIGATVYAWTTTPDSIGFYPVQGDDITIRVEYDKPVSTSLGWMNYIAINARRKLIFDGPDMSFRDHLSYGLGEVAEYKISGADNNLLVWDVTDPFNITSQSGILSGDIYTFLAPADEIREFIAFSGSDFNSAEFIEEVQNQNLHSYEPVEYIILTHPDFMEQADRMLTLHHTFDDMNGFIVTPQEIYNEFGSGKQDPAAIRDFLRMLYEKADSANKPRYLLLLGDASYDYKDRVPNNTNLIPTYQSVEALKLGYSFVTDDFFGLFDPAEGVNAYGKSVDIGIGRFPVHTVEQADEMVDKVETYMTLKPDVLGNWKNNICFIADDEDQNLHFTQAEKLQYMIDTGYQEYNRHKIYLDAFPQVSSPSGKRYPDVNIAINDMMDVGGLVVNYTGHGGEGGWAHESILDIPAINSWTNWNRLPMFITATCEFSRYDDPSIISAGECVFLNPGGGGIGLMTTSRLAWADPNFRLNKAIYKFMFKRPRGEYYRLGDIMRMAKTDQNNGTNIKNFVLLGDPAMRMAYPQLNIETLQINGNETSMSYDTLSAMSEVTIHGLITDLDGDTVKDFNGILYPSIYDKDVMLSTLGNDVGSLPAQFYVIGQKLYEGKFSVVNGEFTFTFFMPQNMATYYGFGKISYYAYDTLNNRDAHGYYRVKIGGVNQDVIPDQKGPELSLYMNNTAFVSGGLTDKEPVFLAHLFDEHGINFTGNGIGRDITLTLDGDPLSTEILNDIFDPDQDSYQSGWVSFPYSGLEDGLHTLTLKAWDNMNNPSEQSIEFVVSVDTPVALTGVMNYPNPFNETTHFVFYHNKPGNSFDIEIRIFNISGQHVTSLRQHTAAEGLTISPLVWDGTDSEGNKLGNGIYIYRMYVTDEQGAQFVQTSKLIFTGSMQ